MQPGLGTRTLVHLTMHFSDIPMKECSDSELPHREITAKKKNCNWFVACIELFCSHISASHFLSYDTNPLTVSQRHCEFEWLGRIHMYTSTFQDVCARGRDRRECRCWHSHMVHVHKNQSLTRICKHISYSSIRPCLMLLLSAKNNSGIIFLHLPKLDNRRLEKWEIL